MLYIMTVLIIFGCLYIEYWQFWRQRQTLSQVLWQVRWGRAVILMMIFVQTFKIDVVFISNVTTCFWRRFWQIIFSIGVSLLILTISLGNIKEKMFKLPIKKHAVNVNIYLFVWVIYYRNNSKYFSFEEQIYYTVYWIK
jgi:hypothetical protein